MQLLCALALLSCCISVSSRTLLSPSSGNSSSNSSSPSSPSHSSSSPSIPSNSSSSPSSPSNSSIPNTGPALDSSLPGDWTFGRSTYYGGAPDHLSPYQPSFGTKDGGCGYGVLNKTVYPYWSVAALSTSNKYYKAGPDNGCGECFELQCLQEGGSYPGNCNSDPNQRSVTVMITDGCPECEADHMDLQALTFEKIAPLAGGNVDMRYRRVACTPPSNIQINVDSNACTDGWLRLHVEQVGYRGSISLVQVKSETSGWEALTNKWGAAWELSNSPAPPLDIRVQDDDGSEVTAFGAISKNCQTGTITTRVQFGGPSTDSSSSTSPSEPEVTAFEGPPSDPSTEDIPKIGGPAGRVDPCVTAFDGSTSACSSPASPSSTGNNSSATSSNDSSSSSPAASPQPPSSSPSPASNDSSPSPSLSPSPSSGSSPSSSSSSSSPSSESSDSSSPSPSPSPSPSSSPSSPSSPSSKSSNSSSPSPVPSPSPSSASSNSSSPSPSPSPSPSSASSNSSSPSPSPSPSPSSPSSGSSA